MTGVEWADWVIITAAVITAILTIWRKAVRPVIHAANQIADAAPVLLGIAAEFQANHGTSLRDVVDRIEMKADAANVLAGTAVELVTEARDEAREANVSARAAMGMSEANGTKIESVGRRLEDLSVDRDA